MLSFEKSFEYGIYDYFTCIDFMMYLHDFLHCLGAANMIKWRLAGYQLIRQHSQTPNINTHIVLEALGYLRGDVVSCPTDCLPPLIAEGCPPEITQLAHILTIV